VQVQARENMQFACCRYSSLSETSKETAFVLWRRKWNRFLEQSLALSSEQSCERGTANDCEVLL